MRLAAVQDAHSASETERKAGAAEAKHKAEAESKLEAEEEETRRKDEGKRSEKIRDGKSNLGEGDAQNDNSTDEVTVAEEGGEAIISSVRTKLVAPCSARRHNNERPMAPDTLPMI